MKLNTVEVINWMIDNKKGLKATVRELGVPYSTLRGRIEKEIAKDVDLMIRYEDHMESMKPDNKKVFNYEDNLIAIYFMQKEKVTSSDILDYSLRMKNETPVADIIKLLEMSGKRVIRA